MTMRYGLSLKMDMENAAFEGNNRAIEAARILRRLADNLENGALNDFGNAKRCEGYLRDANGNTCGTWNAKLRRIRD